MFGRAHTQGDSVVFVPQDRIAYLSEVFFSEEFPNMAQGYGVSWLQVLDRVAALGADIFVPGHGPIPEDPKETRVGLQRMRQILVDARDAIQKEISRGGPKIRLWRLSASSNTRSCRTTRHSVKL
jgi:glyoxylase-like metal-dependent hydrolase (beta-lactamase superfamily II)